MKKLLLSVLLLSIVVLASCTTIQDYISGTDSESPTGFVTIQNPFVFINDTNETNATNSSGLLVEEDTPAQEQVVEQVQEENSDLVLTTITVTEGDIVSLSDLQAQDPDGDTIQFSYSEPLNELGLWQTNDGDEGKYLVTVEATDGILSTTEQVQIVVLASNKGPVIECPESLSFNEGDLIDIDCTIYDREGDEVTFTVSGFMDELTYQTTFEDAGLHTVIIAATDGNRRTSHEVEITIDDVNRLPEVEDISLLSALEGEVVRFSVEATDADNDELTVTYPLLFGDNGVWQTEQGDAGTYELEVVVSDGKEDVIVPFNVLIEKVNVPPTLSVISRVEVDEGETIELSIEATDEDGDDIETSISGFMTSQTYTTTFDDAGDHTVTVTVTDGQHTVEETISITVNNVNRPPVFVFNR